MTDHDQGFIRAFAAKAGRMPDHAFARFNGAAITFAALEERSDAVAAGLRGLGLKVGDRVAVMMANSPAALAVLFGLAKAGLAWVPLNAQLKGEGLRYIIEHCEPGAVICDSDLVTTIRASGAALDGAGLIVADDPAAPLSLDAMLAAAMPFDADLPGPDDLFAIMYTSGTTGRPKGVMVTHGMMRLAGEAVAKVSAARAGDVLFAWEPLYHIGGAQLIVLPVIREVSLAMVDRFSASRFWDQVRGAGATHIHYLGGILQILLKQPESPDDIRHPVRIAWGGGCPKEIWSAFQARFGVEMRECYGMTEASSITTCNDDGTIGAVGRPMPWFEVAIVDAAGHAVPAGEKGEIVVGSNRAGAIFQGYFRNPEASARALRDGRLHTGDLGSVDAAGRLWFHGRMTDSVRCRGENVSAFEVESVAAGHPAVEDCAMIGVTAEIGEQDIKLFVKPKAGREIDVAAFSGWLAERLAPYQNPRYLAVVAEFERTPSQRIMKHRLPVAVDDCFDRLADRRPATFRRGEARRTAG
ncbi:MAG: AMP-binding protein [Phreatobacter sp.]